jgi:hypothetical protein
MSDPWSGADTSSLKNFTDWWGTHSASLTAAQRAKYQPYLNQISSINSGYMGWSDPNNAYRQKYQGYETGMNSLLQRLGAGVQSSDLQSAQGDVASLYGYSPASWTALQQGMGDRLNATNVMTNAGNIATQMQGSEFGQQQAQAMRVAQKQAAEGVGKQLESVFGARGGLAGFQAAYDMTGQMQNAFVQQAAKNSLDMLDRGVAAVNAENQYYEQLINNGAIQAQDYVKFRWDSLQTGYQDYMVAMNQAVSEYNTDQGAITRQAQALSSQLALEMGVDQAILDQANTAYTLYSTQAQDAQSQKKSNWTKFWESMFTTGDWSWWSGG